MSLLIDLIFKECASEYLNQITSEFKSNPFQNDFNLQELNINTLDQNLYIVYNLKPFLSSIEKRGYIITPGPKKLRGKVCKLDYKLHCLDSDFRSSLYRHNQYHSQELDYLNLSRDKFSYENIHNNLNNR